MKLLRSTSKKDAEIVGIRTLQANKHSGSAIKNNIQSVLSKKYGELDTRNLFDGIDDKDVEANIETAENTIQTNIDRGILSKTDFSKLPNLRDGLALSFAAANKGNSRAAAIKQKTPDTFVSGVVLYKS